VRAPAQHGGAKPESTLGHRDFEIVRLLKAAVSDGDFEGVKGAMAWGQSLLGSEVDGALGGLFQTDAKELLHDAAQHGRADIVSAFLAAGADVNAVDSLGDTPLHRAVSNGHERVVWALLSSAQKVDLDVENQKGETALVQGHVLLRCRPPEAAIRAVLVLSEFAGLERLRKVKDALKAAFKTRIKNSRSLVDAALDGKLDLVQDELFKYADPDSKRDDGLTALTAAVRMNHKPIVDVLLNFVALAPNELENFLVDAIEKGFVKIAERLVTAGARITNFFRAFCPCDEESADEKPLLFEIMLAVGAADTEELLVYAIVAGFENFPERLVTAGARIKGVAGVVKEFGDDSCVLKIRSMPGWSRISRADLVTTRTQSQHA